MPFNVRAGGRVSRRISGDEASSLAGGPRARFPQAPGTRGHTALDAGSAAAGDTREKTFLSRAIARQTPRATVNKRLEPLLRGLRNCRGRRATARTKTPKPRRRDMPFIWNSSSSAAMCAEDALSSHARECYRRTVMSAQTEQEVAYKDIKMTLK